MEPTQTGEDKQDNSTSSLKRVPTLKAEAETTGIKMPHPDDTETSTSSLGGKGQTVKKKRNLSKIRSQAARHREKTPEPGRTPVYEDTTTSDDDEVDSNRRSRDMESDDPYEQMRKLVQEQTRAKDEYDIDIEEIKEARLIAENERRRRSISPFALPDKEELYALQRKGSFIDPGNKLLSTTYTVNLKDDNNTPIKNALERKSSLTLKLSPSPTKSDSSNFPFPAPPSPRTQKKIVYPDEVNSTVEKTKETHSLVKRQSFKEPKPQSGKTNETNNKVVESKQSQNSAVSAGTVSSEIKTKVIQVERTPSKTLVKEAKPVVAVRSTTNQGKDSEQAQKTPPVKPARSKSASRIGGKTSDSEMSEDQMNMANQQTESRLAKPKERRQVPRRFTRNRSPAAKRSRSATRVEDLKATATGISKTSQEIMELLQKARGRSLSIPKEDLRIPPEYRNNDVSKKERQLATPNKTPPSSRGRPSSRGISCPKTIEIISEKELLASLTKVQRLNLDFERSRRSSGYIDASQSEYTSSCYSSSPSENEYDFNLSEKTGELTTKLSLLSQNYSQTNTDEKEEDIKTVANLLTRRRKPSIKQTEAAADNAIEKNNIVIKEKTDQQIKVTGKLSSWKIMRLLQQFTEENREQYVRICVLRNKCIGSLLILVIFCGLGGILFRNLEGSFENAYKCGTRNVKRDFIENLWRGSHYLREEDWKSMARKKLFEFEEQLHTAHEAGVRSYSGQKSWTFMNSFVYCLTIITTIGFGHIVPSTKAGRIATILYAIIGIPLFLIVLADFGKLLTRIIKYLWAFVRRVYYTGSCRKVRRTAPMQEMMKGLNMVYDVVRRPSQIFLDEEGGLDAPDATSGGAARTSLAVPGQGPNEGLNIEHPGTEPQTPAPSVFQIDDEFNLPISVAIVILIGYIICGAIIYSIWEPWTFFEAFYFVFISMSTIGFGDYVPKHPMYMMASIVYLVFGLALTSMCINVVQVKLSNTFRQASMKIGATIGLKVAEEDGSLVPISPQPVEIAPVHGSGDISTVATLSVPAKESGIRKEDP